uniref:Ig-like domain-containing protein n=1 Tax=Erpetoichthys calabaricus TaxID=27687 RepID=A0A8C4XA93_ERPCA
MWSASMLDKWMALFCLALWLTYTDGQKVLTQPDVMSVSPGQTASLDCNIQKDESNYVGWQKQVPGSPPKFILRFYHSHSAPDLYGTGFSSSRFTSKASSKIDYQLIISNAEASDSAVYYCETW